MQNYFRKHSEISEFKEFRDIHFKFIKLPILIKLLTFLLLGIVFDTYGYGVRVTAVKGC